MKDEPQKGKNCLQTREDGQQTREDNLHFREEAPTNSGSKPKEFVESVCNLLIFSPFCFFLYAICDIFSIRNMINIVFV